MKVFKIETTEPTQLVQSDNELFAVVGIFVVNYGESDEYFDIFIVPSDMEPPIYDENGNLVSGNEETYFIKNKYIQAGDTFMLNIEKLILTPGDSIYIRKYTNNSKISVHISYVSM